jgi:hypothetical protein
MKYTFHIVNVFSSTPFGGNQLAVLPVRPCPSRSSIPGFRRAAQDLFTNYSQSSTSLSVAFKKAANSGSARRTREAPGGMRGNLVQVRSALCAG